MMEKQLVSSTISDYVRGITFEDDGSADGVSLKTGYSHFSYILRSWSRSVIDYDGSLTGHVGGGPGFVLVPDTLYGR